MRVSVSMNMKLRIKSGVFVSPARFKDGRFIYPRANQKEVAQLRAVENELQQIESLILDICAERKADVTKEMALAAIEQFRHPEITDEAEEQISFFDAWNDFLSQRDLSKNREDIYRSLIRALHRYEAHRRETRDDGYAITLDSFTAEDIADFERFFRNEWKYYDEYPQIYIDYPVELRTQHKTHRPQKRGDNFVAGTLKKIRTFFTWCNLQDITTNRPFDKYTGIKTEKYGTPYYLTKEERDHIADFDLTEHPQLAIQRDIFIFQCLIGTRVSDLRQLKKSNIVGDMVEYVPQKTKKERTETVRVPLCDKAQEIISRYADSDADRLLPFISDQRYNDAIKKICKLCGIDRVVTIINPTTGKDERRPICEIASSHMARRTFIGNLYKQVQDPNLVGSMTGHKEGSKSFARYREIDDDIKRDIIKLIK